MHLYVFDLPILGSLKGTPCAELNVYLDFIMCLTVVFAVELRDVYVTTMIKPPKLVFMKWCTPLGKVCGPRLVFT